MIGEKHLFRLIERMTSSFASFGTALLKCAALSNALMIGGREA